MNYETSITSEAAEPVATEIEGARRVSAGGLPRNLLIAGAVILGLLLAIIAYFALAGGEPSAAGDDDSQAPVVTVIVPGQTDIAGIIEAPGTIAARREMPVGVEGEGGRVQSVPVDAGEWVRQGQVLAVIDRAVQTQQIAAQQAQVEVAKADAALAAANLERAKQLVERGFVSKADIDRLTAERNSARARVDVARAQLNELRARTARLNVTAPASGYILSRNVEPGQSVSAGSPALFSIARGGEMEMLAQVNEAQMAQLSQGVMANVQLTGSDKEFEGQIWQLSPVIEANTRQGTARIALPFSRDLRPGGFATARINGGQRTATVLPESAVLVDEEGAYVFAVDEENTAQRLSVTIGDTVADGIVITEGLTGSERIVLSAGGFLNPGETVDPKRQEG